MRKSIFFTVLTGFLTASISFTPINVTANNFDHSNSCYPNHNIRWWTLKEFNSIFSAYIKRVETFNYYDYADSYGTSMPECVICVSPAESHQSINTMHINMFVTIWENLFMYLWWKVWDSRMEDLAEMYINMLQQQYKQSSSPRSRNMLIWLALWMNRKKAQLYDCTWRYEYSPSIDNWFVF